MSIYNETSSFNVTADFDSLNYPMNWCTHVHMYMYMRTCVCMYIQTSENKVYPYAYCMSVHVCMWHMYLRMNVNMQWYIYNYVRMYATVAALVPVCYPMWLCIDHDWPPSTATLHDWSCLPGLWFREFFLELNMGERIQVYVCVCVCVRACVCACVCVHLCV